ncbi:MAG: endonuclease III [Candidatus Bathyarchaeia archaeon]
MEEKQRAAKVLRTLQQTLSLPSWVKSKRDPFETLVVTIISQNTADRNTVKAFENLSKRLEITPEALANAKLSQIEEAIRPAGLFKSKAKAIRQAAVIILEKYYGTLQPILTMPLEKAREALMQFPGVGPKTADVVLLFSAKQPTIPVDTHVNRVAKRLGFAPMNGNYEAVRNSLQSLFRPNDYIAVHILLIQHGRKTCKARHPLCDVCPVNKYCPTRGQWG